MTPRVAIVVFSQETSSFNIQPTTVETFEAYGLVEGADVLADRSGHEIGGFLQETERAGLDWEPCPVIYASAGAHGPLTAHTRASFEERITDGIRAAAPLDAVYMALHGAAAAEDEPDTEGRLLVPILRGELKPTIAWRKIPLITHQEQFLTAAGPMKTWFDRARAMERLPGVASASTFPMQPWLDVPEGGWACAVVTHDDRELAERLAAELANLAWALREEFLKQESIAPEAAVAQAIAADQGLVVLSDTGDSTTLLAELLRQRPSEMALVPMVDAHLAERAERAGVGGAVRGPIGGRLDPRFGRPVPIEAEVLAVGGGRIDVPVQGLPSFDMGTACLLRSGEILIVVSEQRGIGGNHPAVYEHFGVDVARAKMVVVKTASNWQYFGRWISRVIRVDTPGGTQSGLQELAWQHLPRPIYPLDPLPSWTSPPARG